MAEFEAGEQMMTHALHLFGTGRGGYYRDVTVDLARVGRNDVAAEMARGFYGEGGFPRRRRPRDDNAQFTVRS